MPTTTITTTAISLTKMPNIEHYHLR